MYTLILDLLFFLAVFSAILTITARNPVMALLSLIAVFISVSGYLAIIGLTFLSLVYLIIYVGGIAVLFLFVIMMLDIKAEEVPAASGGVGGIDPFLIGVFSVLLLLSGLNTPYLVILFDWFSLGSVHISCAPSWQWSIGFATFSQLASLGIYLFTVIPVSVLLIGLILLLALISPIVLSLPGVTKPSSTNSPHQSNSQVSWLSVAAF